MKTDEALPINVFRLFNANEIEKNVSGIFPIKSFCENKPA